MSRPFSSGDRALGICDRCGFTYKLHDLEEEYLNEAPTDLLVCRTCFDPDHPQLRKEDLKLLLEDPQALRDPRNDTGKIDSISLFGWKPVYSDPLTSAVGKVTTT